MENLNKLNTVQLVFFSGTGGTKRIADSFEQEMIKRNFEVEVKNLGNPRRNDMFSESDSQKIDFYILIFPVYAFDVPKPVYNWIRSINNQGKGKKIAVISVSGGGEVWPNTGCRNDCCRELEDKGFCVVYDRMMCMPANMAVKVNDHLAMWLINVIPEKVNDILDDLLSNQIRRTNYRKSLMGKYLTNLENKNAKKFAQELIITDDCKNCGWCIKNCPMENIVKTAQASKPQFLDRCIICLRCVYGCPFRAIQSKRSVIFKSGFDLDAVEKRMEGVELMPVEKCCKGLMLIGVKKYLINKG